MALDPADTIKGSRQRLPRPHGMGRWAGLEDGWRGAKAGKSTAPRV
jgi:hypothetical protein